MTKQDPFFKWDKYAKLEWAFFIFIWMIMPLMSDLEYSLNELPHGQQESNQVAIIRRVVWGIYGIIPYYLFYKLAIQRLLIKKQYGYFLLSILAFIVLEELYLVYVEYWSLSKMSFLPVEITSDAVKWGQNKGMHFTIHYLLLQILQMVALAYYIHYDKQQKEVQALKQLQTETDLQYLKTQLQPHFFFNTLNNIYSLALQQSQQTAPMIAKLSSLMRYVLYEAAQPKLSLSKEIAFIADYIDIQSVRYNEKIHIRFDMQGITGTVLIEPLLLLPFIENAFKHGIEEEQGTGYIEIIICEDDLELTLSVKNSKAAKTDNPSPTTGIGVANARKRLALLYPGKHSLHIRETDQSYEVLLTIIK
jgi:sensor histidine kinase YesM